MALWNEYFNFPTFQNHLKLLSIVYLPLILVILFIITKIAMPGYAMLILAMLTVIFQDFFTFFYPLDNPYTDIIFLLILFYYILFEYLFTVYYVFYTVIICIICGVTFVQSFFCRIHFRFVLSCNFCNSLSVPVSIV